MIKILVNVPKGLAAENTEGTIRIAKNCGRASHCGVPKNRMDSNVTR